MSLALNLGSEIRDVKDTARVMAGLRAMEAARPDYILNDPFAKDLAGPEMDQLINSIPNQWVLSSAVIFRTVLMDEIILRLASAHHIDCVISLGAGLDARPYRLELESKLRWIEVDMPEILDYKHQVLKREKPRCRYQCFGFDLSDRTQLRQLLQKNLSTGGSTLVLTEGLLYYLEEQSVGQLAEDLERVGRCDYWLVDVISKQALWWLQHSWGPSFGNAQMHFAARRGQGTFLDWGYRVLEQYGLITEGMRRGRSIPSKYLQMLGVGDKVVSRMLLDDLARVVLLRRVGAQELPPPKS